MSFLDKLSKAVTTANEIRSFIVEQKPTSETHPQELCTETYRDPRKRESASFDMKKVTRIGCGFLLKGDNQKKAIADILSLNEFFKEAHSLCRSFPTVKITESMLDFKGKRNQTGFPLFCYLTAAPKTKAGNAPKYPLVLEVNCSEELFGKIFYLSSGAIGRVEFIIWHREGCYELHLTTDNCLSVNAVYKHSSKDSKRKKLYERQ